jgi:hypothetical protein
MNLLQNNPRLERWTQPPPMDTGAPCPAIHSNGGLLCAYFINPTSGAEGSVALLKFETVLHYRFGYPNDEALRGHPLHEFGLKPYGFFVVENSPLIREMENQNRFHQNHSPGMYGKFRHWVITFHDETLEVIALRGTILGQTQTPPEKAVCG